MAHILERAHSLREKASMLARQPGHSLTWLLDGTIIDPYFGMLNREAAITAMVMAEEDRPMFHAIKKQILDPLALEEALKSHAIWEDLGHLLEDSLKRFFKLSKNEVIAKFAELEELEDRLFNIRLVDAQVKPEPDFRPDARKLYKLFNKLSSFDKASTVTAIPIESR